MQMTKPFSAVLDRVGVKSPFTRNWLDLLCFCLSGLNSDGTITAEMAMMFAEFCESLLLLPAPCSLPPAPPFPAHAISRTDTTDASTGCLMDLCTNRQA